ncbi:MAG: hypothetical protein APF76_16300 [Desulfitibacter sp. BRH_c19]|nr:MAG: hypothetical protein APF76_16300 [Desulfitibacter sp. BRH_c19]
MLNIDQLKEYEKELISLRRHFHMHPELANEEYETAKYIEKYLHECGLEVIKGFAKTGIVGILKGKEGPSIGIRAEMDALPINETNDVIYKSRYPYKMHACGHDGHMAVTLVTAKILSKMKDKLNGSIVFIFQPAEENLPEGGAKRFCKEARDILKDLKAIFGFHFWPSTESGKVAVSKDPMMAAGDIFEVVFNGMGAHGANPHQSSDVLLMTSASVLSLTNIVARNIRPGIQATLSVGVIEGGKSPNVLPAESIIKGTTRYLSEDLKDVFPEKIDRVLDGISKAYSGSYKLKYSYGYPLLQNNEAMVDVVQKCAESVVGKSNLIEKIGPSLTSEDFAVFLKDIPGCHFWIGTYNPNNNLIHMLHNPQFDLDEAVMIIPVRILLMICQQLVNS